ncbi:aminoglycoside phosphotransferase family protein [Anaerolineales bacterium HSG25]|nr:aminoglycoside phosphotransferase family protein [Anaerolineales bacterium HSG25]
MVSTEFKQQIVAVWKEEGRAWLKQLPALIHQCAERWNLSVQAPMENLSYNFVARAVQDDGTPAILKIGVPNPELATEIEALRHYQGRHAVKLLAADLSLGAFLIERVRPGQTLSTLTDDETATRIAAPLIRDLPIPEPANHAFPTVKDWTRAFAGYRTQFGSNSGPLPFRLLGKAERLFQELHASTKEQKLLHGDLHHENILLSGKNEWRVIDPKGVIGDPAYETARFQHNPMPQFLTMTNPATVAIQRSEILAETLGVNRARLLAWAFVDVVLAACWWVEDGGEDLSYSLGCLEIFDRLTD